MSKKIWRKYTYSYYKDDSMSAVREGYHDWADGKWLTNFCSFVKLGNPRLKNIPQVDRRVNMDFSKFIPKELKPELAEDCGFMQLEKQDVLNITSIMKIKTWFYDFRILGLMMKVNDAKRFFALQYKGMLLLYTFQSKEYELQGMLLPIKVRDDECDKTKVSKH